MPHRFTSKKVLLSEGADENGFAMMLSELIRQNLEDHPEKLTDFNRLTGRVAIVVEDAEVSITLHFKGGYLVVHSGIFGIPDLTIRADADDVTKMSLMEMTPILGLPDLRKENSKAIARASREGRIHMFGMLRNLPMVLRLTRVMSIN